MNTVKDFYKMKKAGEKITMITCYDYTSAKLLEKSGVDCILVGDSAAMVVHGFPDTTNITVEMMATHVRAVARGATNTFIIGDMPFMSYRISQSDTMKAVTQLMQAGAQAIKLEGARGNLETIKHIVESGVPVMGHIGLTPQHIHALGGFTVQGKAKQAQQELLIQAKQCEDAGCFAIVLECVPESCANTITSALSIPTIGIGAGAATGGQVLVYHDLLGLQTAFKPKFVKHFMQGESVVTESLQQYIHEVKNRQYPAKEHSYAGD